MTMLEKAARAAYGANITAEQKYRGWSKTDWSAIHPNDRDNWRQVARAVLLAVREPEIDGVFDSNNGRGQPYWYEEAARSDFTAMIDAILDGK